MPKRIRNVNDLGLTKEAARNLMDTAITAFEKATPEQQQKMVRFKWRGWSLKCELTSFRYIVWTLKGEGVCQRWC